LIAAINTSLEDLCRAKKLGHVQIVRRALPPATRDGDDFDRRNLHYEKFCQELEPICFRHYDVRDDQVNFGGLEELQSFLAIPRIEHGVAKVGQGQAQHLADRIVVVDEEDSGHG
jgi:hypothetical protein